MADVNIKVASGNALNAKIGSTEYEILNSSGEMTRKINTSSAATFSNTVDVGEDDTGYDVNIYGATSGQKVFWDASADTLNLDCTIQADGTFTVGVDDTGYDVTLYGDTSGQKVFWDASADTFNLDCTVQVDGTVSVGVDDTGYDVTLYGDTASAYAMWDASEDRFVIAGSASFAIGDTTGTGVFMSIGVSGTPVTTATADKKLVAWYGESTATSGDNRLLYAKFQLNGTIAASGYGDGARIWTEVEGTGYNYASGIHATMSVAAGATVTGSGSALRATLGAAAESRTLVGALACLNLDSDIGANNTVPSRCSMIRCTKAGSVDIPFFLDIADDQFLTGGAAGGAASDAIQVLTPGGTTKLINLHDET